MTDILSFILLTLGASLVVAPIIYSICKMVIDYQTKQTLNLISGIAEILSKELKSYAEKIGKN